MKNANIVKNKQNTNKRKNVFAVITGALAGLINGVFGGGGGMIVVPMLTKFLKCPVKKSHATALLIILPLSITSGLFYTAFGSLELNMAVPVTIGVICGGVLGALLLSKLSAKWVSLIFSVVMIGAGVKMLLF